MFVNDIIDMIEVEIDKDSGFCFGVVTAIESAERELGNTDTLYCLGDIVHNSLEVERLEDMGLHTIDHACARMLRAVPPACRRPAPTPTATTSG